MQVPRTGRGRADKRSRATADTSIRQCRCGLWPWPSRFGSGACLVVELERGSRASGEVLRLVRLDGDAALVEVSAPAPSASFLQCGPRRHVQADLETAPVLAVRL